MFAYCDEISVRRVTEITPGNNFGAHGGTVHATRNATFAASGRWSEGTEAQLRHAEPGERGTTADEVHHSPLVPLSTVRDNTAGARDERLPDHHTRRSDDARTEYGMWRRKECHWSLL